MKTFKRTSLPEQIKYNGKTYEYGQKAPESIKVEVLSTSLKGRTDLHGRPYAPTVHYFNPVKVATFEELMNSNDDFNF